MLRKVGLGRLLPLLNLVLYAATLCFANAGQSRLSSAQPHATNMGTILALVKISTALNVPAVLIGDLLAAIVFHFQLDCALVLAIPFVPPFCGFSSANGSTHGWAGFPAPTQSARFFATHSLSSPASSQFSPP
jgi:hypothetical protein